MKGKSHMIAWTGGILACIVLLATGIAYTVIGFNGRSEVRDTLKREKITGTPDMKVGGIAADPKLGTLPDCSVAGEAIDTGSRAKCFASYMRVHALESTGGLVYAEMGRYLDKDGKPTSDEALAAKNPQSGRPVENPLRNLWVTETALATGLDMAYFAEQVSLFAVVMGFALIVIGIGMGVMTIALFGIAPWTRGKEGAAAEPAAAP